ncbi:MAG: TraR/DksA C4-type zinc finger protein [Phycisphaerae bacterium]
MAASRKKSASSASGAAKKKKVAASAAKKKRTTAKPTRKTATRAAPVTAKAARGKTVKSVRKAKPVTAAASRKTQPAKMVRPAPARPIKIKSVIRTAADRAWMKSMKDRLLGLREQINSAVRSNRDQLAGSKKDFADIGDRASGGFEDEIAAGLLSIESGQLDEIEGALGRINRGLYGACIDCGKPVPRKRLEILPFAKRCLVCEGQKERQIRPADLAIEEESSDFD